MNKKQRVKNKQNYERLMAKLDAMEKIKHSICPECGNPGPHYVPGGFGDRGFFSCTGRSGEDA